MTSWIVGHRLRTSTSATSSPTCIPTPRLMGPSMKKRVSLCWALHQVRGGDPNDTWAKYNHFVKLYGYYYKRHGTSQLKGHFEEQYNKSLIRCSLVEKSMSRLEIGLQKIAYESSRGSTFKGLSSMIWREIGVI